ncbi:MAG: 6-phosphogluconolactonase, partial [Vicinamibacterales bacterium]
MRSAREAVRWHEVADIEALHHDAVGRVVAASSRAIQARGRFHIVLAGGETPRGVYRMLRSAQTDWTAWSIYFGDERCLPPDDGARNSRMVELAWLDHVTVPADHVHVIAGELGAARAATAYAAGLQGVGDFDLVLLGLGEDGHTASLFPNHDWGARPDAPDVLAVLDAPKPPPERVSLSAARLSRARAVLFLVTGESKRDAV